MDCPKKKKKKKDNRSFIPLLLLSFFGLAVLFTVYRHSSITLLFPTLITSFFLHSDICMRYEKQNTTDHCKTVEYP